MDAESTAADSRPCGHGCNLAVEVHGPSSQAACGPPSARRALPHPMPACSAAAAWGARCRRAAAKAAALPRCARNMSAAGSIGMPATTAIRNTGLPAAGAVCSLSSTPGLRPGPSQSPITPPTRVLQQRLCRCRVLRIGVGRQQVRDVRQGHGAPAAAPHLQRRGRQEAGHGEARWHQGVGTGMAERAVTVQGHSKQRAQHVAVPSYRVQLVQQALRLRRQLAPRKAHLQHQQWNRPANLEV